MSAPRLAYAVDADELVRRHAHDLVQALRRLSAARRARALNEILDAITWMDVETAPRGEDT